MMLCSCRLSNTELLRSYRIAHARVQTIENFETSLRENTPLTSISDPNSLVEYLNQINLKGDMVLDELKRVSNERDSFKQRLNEAEKQTREAWDEAARLRTDKTYGSVSEALEENKEDGAKQDDGEIRDLDDGDPLSVMEKSPPISVKSPTSSIPGISLFSPKLKSSTPPQAQQRSEDLFSYDGEIPRLEGELQAKQEKIESLETDVQKLKTDLTVTRESTQSMVQSLEEATREMNSLRESRDRSLTGSEALEEESDKLRVDLKSAEDKLYELQNRTVPDKSVQIEALESKLQAADSELEILRSLSSQYEAKKEEVAKLEQTVSELKAQLSNAQNSCEKEKEQAREFENTIKDLRKELLQADKKTRELESALEASSARNQTLDETNDKQAAQSPNLIAIAADPLSTSKKKNKKKKRGAKPADVKVQETTALTNSTGGPPVVTTQHGEIAREAGIENLQQELDKLQSQLKQKEAELGIMYAKLKDQDDLSEEIETLRDGLVNVGQELVEAKDNIKELTAEKHALEETVSTLEKELAQTKSIHQDAAAGAERKHLDLAAQFGELKIKATTLQTDLSAAQQLASSRFRESENLRTVLQKAQPEINSLRNEAAGVKTAKEALSKRDAEFKRLDSRHQEMRSEVIGLKQTISSREAEIKLLNQVNVQEASNRSRAEDTSAKAQQNVSRLETEKRQAIEGLDRLSRELIKVREDLTNHKTRLLDVEQKFSKHRSESEGLKEEIELKSAQYASAQSLMSSMRDQTSEMATQMKEARDRCESLDEEVADAHRLLSERSREGETMRRLLADVESRASAQTRAMKERMDMAIEERDRAEEDASTSSRRKARELEEMRDKYRELERSLKRAEEDKDGLEVSQRDWKRRREELEYRAEQATREAEEVRKVMGDLRDTLGESERQARELERQKVELRRSVEETQHRLEKLQKANKVSLPERHTLRLANISQTMADEIGKARESKKVMGSEAHSSRTSMDSTTRIGSPAPPSRTASGPRADVVNGQGSGKMDYVYLKNVLLQFLEQRDKKHQMQLIPVLGMLLHFDKYLMLQVR